MVPLEYKYPTAVIAVVVGLHDNRRTASGVYSATPEQETTFLAWRTELQ